MCISDSDEYILRSLTLFRKKRKEGISMLEIITIPTF